MNWSKFSLSVPVNKKGSLVKIEIESLNKSKPTSSILTLFINIPVYNGLFILWTLNSIWISKVFPDPLYPTIAIFSEDLILKLRFLS